MPDNQPEKNVIEGEIPGDGYGPRLFVRARSASVVVRADVGSDRHVVHLLPDRALDLAAAIVIAAKEAQRQIDEADLSGERPDRSPGWDFTSDELA